MADEEATEGAATGWEPEVVVTGEEPVVTAPGDKMPGFHLAPVGVVEAGEAVHEAEAAARVGGRRMDNAVEMETVQFLEDMFNDNTNRNEYNEHVLCMQCSYI